MLFVYKIKHFILNSEIFIEGFNLVQGIKNLHYL